MPNPLSDMYWWSRRLIRHWVTRSPSVDRSIGGILRRIDRLLPVADALARRQTADRDSMMFDGLRLHFRPEDMGVISSLIRNGEYEPETTEVVKRILEPGMRFVDLGANIGFFTLIGGRAVGPTGAVYAFEPIESTAEVLAKNLIANDLDSITTVVRRAVSDTSRDLTFALHPESSSSHKMVEAAGEGLTTTMITATSLDAFFAPLNWPEIHLVKMDVEGAELNAMRGMQRLSEQSPRLRLIFELHHENLRRLSITGEELFAKLLSLGFIRFNSLHRDVRQLNIPNDIAAAVRLAQRVNYNILCEKE